MEMINIDSKDLYQLLIAECRYGYSRNNHLMPGGAYDHVKEYLPKMLKADKYYAIHTAKQLCDECISMQLVTNFYNGKDDDCANRSDAFRFIEWLLAFVREEEGNGSDWVPYNYYQYLANKAIDDIPCYNIYEGQYALASPEAKENISLGTPVNNEKLSKNTVLNYLFTDILQVEEVTYRKRVIDENTVQYIFDDLKKTYYVKKEN